MSWFIFHEQNGQHFEIEPQHRIHFSWDDILQNRNGYYQTGVMKPISFLPFIPTASLFCAKRS